jgi:hypothetical protein
LYFYLYFYLFFISFVFPPKSHLAYVDFLFPFFDFAAAALPTPASDALLHLLGFSSTSRHHHSLSPALLGFPTSAIIHSSPSPLPFQSQTTAQPVAFTWKPQSIPFTKLSVPFSSYNHKHYNYHKATTLAPYLFPAILSSPNQHQSIIIIHHRVITIKPMETIKPHNHNQTVLTKTSPHNHREPLLCEYKPSPQIHHAQSIPSPAKQLYKPKHTATASITETSEPVLSHHKSSTPATQPSVLTVVSPAPLRCRTLHDASPEPVLCKSAPSPSQLPQSHHRAPLQSPRRRRCP